MANVDLLIKALDTAHWEMGEAFKGLSDDDTWRRPHLRLLSIGEIAAHVCYWEVQSFLGNENNISSPLILQDSRYYSTNIDKPFNLAIKASEVIHEIQRIHKLCKSAFLADPRDSEELNPHRADWTWGATIEYQVFHVSYHTGQIYSARHIFGHETVDN